MNPSMGQYEYLKSYLIIMTFRMIYRMIYRMCQFCKPNSDRYVKNEGLSNGHNFENILILKHDINLTIFNSN